MQTIVIVGGGAGGLELAASLGSRLGKNKRAKIILVDRNPNHIWKPLLHEVATGSLDMSIDGVSYRAHSGQHYYQFQLGTMTGLNGAEKQIHLAAVDDEYGVQVLPERVVSYDTLVMAVGSVSNDFGTPGVAEHSYFLDSHQQAERFQRGLLNSFMRINQQAPDKKLRLAIVGGGATGVELAAELTHVANLLKQYGMPEMSASRLQVDLLEAGPSILPALPARISSAARRELQRLGVIVHENTRVTRADENGYVDQNGDLIAADLMVWAAGVKAPDFIRELEYFELGRGGQIVVRPGLQSSVDDNIWVLGDCAACQQPDGSWVPPRAQSAHQMASHIAASIRRQMKGRPVKPYLYKDHGSLVNLSRYSTVGSLMGNLSGGTMFVEGKIARLMYMSLYRMHQLSIHGWLKGMCLILAQKVGHMVQPKIKLH